MVGTPIGLLAGLSAPINTYELVTKNVELHGIETGSAEMYRDMARFIDAHAIKPVIDCVVMANTVHGYMSQSDKGELVIGGGTDPYNNYSQRGSFPALEHTITALVETFPIISRLRMLRMWGGIVDMTGDRSPIIGKTPVDGLFVNCGWGTGGFKAIPGSGYVFADTIANDRPHPIAEPFGLNRFAEGRFIDESVAAAVAH